MRNSGEEAIRGKRIDEASEEAAGADAVSDAIALPYNKYKIHIAKAMVKKAILACHHDALTSSA